MAADSGTYDQATLQRRAKIAEAMLNSGTTPQKIEHWTQGLAQISRAGMGGLMMKQAEDEARAAKEKDNAALMSILGGGAAPAAAPAMPAPQPPANVPVATAMSTPPASPPVNAARAEVMPSGKVWGDKEAEAAGLYEPSAPKPAPGVKLAQAMTPQASPPAPQGGGVLANVPQAQRDIIIRGLAASEGSPARAIATAMLGNITKSDAPTDETKEYNLAKSQGFQGSFFDFKTQLKKAGATNVTTNVDAKGEDAFAKAAGGAQAKRFDELAGEGQKAKQMVADIETLNDLGTKIKTGKIAEAKAAIGPYAEALGVKVDGLSEIQAYEAIVNRLAPSLRVPGSGAQSDYELKNFLKSLPNLGNTPEGNAIASSVMKGLQENKIRASEIASRALSGEIKREDAEKQLRALPDPMETYRKFMKGRKADAPVESDGWKDLGNGVRIREKK